MIEQPQAPSAEPRPVSVEQTDSSLGDLENTVLVRSPKADVQLLTEIAMSIAISANGDAPVYEQQAYVADLPLIQKEYEPRHNAIPQIIAMTYKLDEFREEAVAASHDPRPLREKLLHPGKLGVRSILRDAEIEEGSKVVANGSGFVSTFHADKQKGRHIWRVTYWDARQNPAQPVEFETYTYLIKAESSYRDAIYVSYKHRDDPIAADFILVDPGTERGMEHLQWLYKHTKSYYENVAAKVYKK